MFVRPLLAASLFALLTACGSGPVKRISPPTASVQELSLHADGQWHLRVRVQNFSNVSMTFNSLDAVLSINDEEAGRIDAVLDLDIPGGNADVFEATLTPKAGLKPISGNVAYQLKGSIGASDPKGSHAFERSSHLMPVPGLTDTWR